MSIVFMQKYTHIWLKHTCNFALLNLSTEDTTNNDDASPYSLTDSAMGGSAMSPEPLDESHEINGSASGHDKSHCSSMSDDREVNFESYGENNDVEYDQ